MKEYNRDKQIQQRSKPYTRGVINHSKEDKTNFRSSFKGLLLKMLARLFPAVTSFWRLLCNKPETDHG